MHAFRSSSVWWESEGTCYVTHWEWRSRSWVEARGEHGGLCGAQDSQNDVQTGTYNSKLTDCSNSLYRREGQRPLGAALPSIIGMCKNCAEHVWGAVIDTLSDTLLLAFFFTPPCQKCKAVIYPEHILTDLLAYCTYLSNVYRRVTVLLLECNIVVLSIFACFLEIMTPLAGMCIVPPACLLGGFRKLWKMSENVLSYAWSYHITMYVKSKIEV